MKSCSYCQAPHSIAKVFVAKMTGVTQGAPICQDRKACIDRRYAALALFPMGGGGFVLVLPSKGHAHAPLTAMHTGSMS